MLTLTQRTRANEYLHHYAGYKMQEVRRNPNLFKPSSFSNVSADTTAYLKDKLLNENVT